MKFRFLVGSLLATAVVLSTAGCSLKSYPADNIKQSLTELCRKEYGIEQLDVKVSGNTIGVYLPLAKLFAADFKEAAVTGKVRNLESLFEPSPEALEKVEDVLFSISRVLLSTDKEFEFYVLQATDVENTGLQLVLTGYVDDIRRVRIWDIPRSEYRKRVVHELRLNRAVKWHQPVRAFYRDLGRLSLKDIRTNYFNESLPAEAIQTIFMDQLWTGGENEPKKFWEIDDIRSTALQNNEVLVYTRVTPYTLITAPSDVPAAAEQRAVPGPSLQYLFMVSFANEQAQILRIIPFQYRESNGQIRAIPFPRELQIERNLENWEQEFPLPSIEVGPFLADQLTRRMQAILVADERIHNTFRQVDLQFDYEKSGEAPHFNLSLEASLRDLNNYKRDSLVLHEDMLYLLSLISREFVDVLRSYRFGDYNYLSLNLAQESASWTFGRDDLELFRKNKIDVQGLLSVRQF